VDNTILDRPDKLDIDNIRCDNGDGDIGRLLEQRTCCLPAKPKRKLDIS